MSNAKRKSKKYYLYRNPTPGTCEVLTLFKKWKNIADVKSENSLTVYSYYTDARDKAYDNDSEYEGTDQFDKRRKDAIAFQKMFEVQS